MGYGQRNATLQKQSWTPLRRVGEHRSSAWFVIGDFNELYKFETTIRLGRTAHQMQFFGETVEALNLMEIRMEQVLYIWWNKPTGATSVRFCDHVFCSLYGTVCAHTLPVPSSDHHALLLKYS